MRKRSPCALEQRTEGEKLPATHQAIPRRKCDTKVWSAQHFKHKIAAEIPPTPDPTPMDSLERHVQAARVRQSAHVEVFGGCLARRELCHPATDQLGQRGARDAVGARREEDHSSWREPELADVRQYDCLPRFASLPAVKPVNDTENGLGRVHAIRHLAVW